MIGEMIFLTVLLAFMISMNFVHDRKELFNILNKLSIGILIGLISVKIVNWY